MHPAGTVGGQSPHWSEPTSAGTTLDSTTFSGKAVYLNFFASWCPPCNDEAPTINRLNKKYAHENFTVIGVDVAENALIAAKFVAKYGLIYPVIADNGQMQSAYAINGLPEHVFIERNGTIHRIVVGEMTPAEIESNIKAIL